MDLPIRLFFALYKQGQKEEALKKAIHYRELVYISRTPASKVEYAELLEDRYNAIIDPQSLEVPQAQSNPAIDLADIEAKNILQDIMRNVKRGMGYG